MGEHCCECGVALAPAKNPVFVIRDMRTGLWLRGENAWTTCADNAMVIEDEREAHALVFIIRGPFGDPVDARVFERTYLQEGTTV